MRDSSWCADSVPPLRTVLALPVGNRPPRVSKASVKDGSPDSVGRQLGSISLAAAFCLRAEPGGDAVSTPDAGRAVGTVHDGVAAFQVARDHPDAVWRGPWLPGFPLRQARVFGPRIGLDRSRESETATANTAGRGQCRPVPGDHRLGGIGALDGGSGTGRARAASVSASRRSRRLRVVQHLYGYWGATRHRLSLEGR